MKEIYCAKDFFDQMLESAADSAFHKLNNDNLVSEYVEFEVNFNEYINDARGLYTSAMAFCFARFSSQTESSFYIVVDGELKPFAVSVDNEVFVNEFIISAEANIKRNFIYKDFDTKRLDFNSNIIFNFSDTEFTDIADNLLFSIKNSKLYVKYGKGLYDESRLQSFLNAVVVCVDNFKNNIKNRLSVISLLNNTQKRELLEFSYGGKQEYDTSKCFIHKFIENAEVYKDKLAVHAINGEFTYSELDKYSNSLAKALRNLGVKNNDFVGLMLPREIEFLMCIMSIHKAGAGYIPIDANYPDDRIDHIIHDSKASVIISSKALANERLNQYSDIINILYLEDFEISLDAETINFSTPDAPAYMIYTSGSTGKPKGVMIPQRALCAYMNGFKNTNYEVFDTDRNACYTNFSFDVSIDDIFGPLFAGASTFIIPSTIILEIDKVVDFLIENKITAASVPTPFGVELLKYDQLKLRYMKLAGEKLLPIKHSNISILNGYGPTEFTVISNLHTLNKQFDYKNIPIGRPLHNSYSYVLDNCGNLLPKGAIGELFLSGNQIAKGYWNRDELTAQKFTQNQFSDLDEFKIKYATGDLVYWNDNYDLVCLGRNDDQVKLRGFRIELGEIESVIKKYKGITSAVALVRQAASTAHLFAYITANEKINIADLKAYLARLLAVYMVPSEILQIDKMPLSANGKTDKKKLPEINVSASDNYITPITKTQELICDIFQRVLNIEKVGIKDNYFDIGGTSISAIRVVVESGKENIRFTYADLFQYKTPEALSEFLDNQSKAINEVNNHFNIADYNYEPINKVLSKIQDVDIWAKDFIDTKNIMQSVVLTGATGYLGIHILYQLLNSDVKQIYCIVRSNEKLSAKQRLNDLLAYYFEEQFSADNIDKITIIDSDITDNNLDEKLACYNFDTIINTAAIVKHFISDESIKHSNIDGVVNLINICEKFNSRLIQISTYDVAGINELDTSLVLNENDLYVNQSIKNEYVLSKYIAERYVLQAVADNRIKAKIMRAGNLMARESDCEFQINFQSNAFMKKIRSFKMLKKFPLLRLVHTIDLSPIDRVAEAIVKLSYTHDDMVLFHPFNFYSVDYSVLMRALTDYGFDIEYASRDNLLSTIKSLTVEKKNIILEGLIIDEQNMFVKAVIVNNKFTTTILHKLGFHWNNVEYDYFTQMIELLDSRGFFDEIK